MCGIAGFLGKARIDEEIIADTLKLMGNRGPDHHDFISIHTGNSCANLLHSRLSIIDLDPRANQPFTVGPYSLVFNGEIYNYLELRHDLEQKGVSFSTESDTEVLIHCYIEYGDKCVDRFEGMWSFAIYDNENESLFLSRDRFSEKPLYYLESKEGFYFGSEVKFIQSLVKQKLTVNRKHLLGYLVNGYKSLYKHNQTFFEEIQEVPFATNLYVGRNQSVKTKKYWTPAFYPQDMTLNDAVQGFRERLIESMKLRLRSDVPLAFCLSGGIDSASLVSIAAKTFNYDVATFSILDSDERYNEYDNMKATIDDIGCKHTFIEIPQEGVFQRLKQLIAYHDAPVYTISYYIHSFLSEEIAKDGYKVAISGTGADELVTGYYDHFNLHLYEVRNHDNFDQYLREWEGHISQIVRNPFLQNPNLYSDDPTFRDHIYLNNDVFAGFLKNEFSEAFIEESYCDSLLRNRMMNEMFNEAVPQILHEDDLNSMYYSIENRSPFLDKNLFEFAYQIPSEYLINDGFGKHILREAVKGILNETVRTDRRKKGFNASFSSLVDLNDKNELDFLLEDSVVFNYFEREKIEKLLSMEFIPNSYSKFLFYFLNAKIFLELNS
jgi:asparagine synthase (glutamine-hydrolysing)